VKCCLAFAVMCLAALGQAQNVLVWSTGNNFAPGNTPHVAEWIQESGQFTSAVGINMNTGMTAEYLDSFDKVLYFSNGSFGQDPEEVGDLLGQFAATGKRLVLATFSWSGQGTNTLGGDILNYSPFAVNGISLYSDVTIGSTDGSSFWNGVDDIDAYYHDDVVVTNGATLRGTWSDGSPILANNGEVVGLNMFPDDNFERLEGDNRQLTINALTQPVPEPLSTVGLLGALTTFVVRRRRPS